MLVTIIYDRLFSDGSAMEMNYQFKNEDFDLSIIPDILATFCKSMDNKGKDIKIINIIIAKKLVLKRGDDEC